MDIFNVEKIKRSIYCDALLGDVMVFISPLLDVSCFEMLALTTILKMKSLLMGHKLGIQKGHVGCFFHLTLRGHLLMCHFCLSLSGH
jgi:hypothetical protein